MASIAGVWAETDRGSIVGTVSDQTSAVVGGAAVIATNMETGVTTKVTISSNGNYTIPFIKDEVPGVPVFSAAKRSGHFDPNADTYLNPAAFVNPPTYSFGTAPWSLANARGPSYLNEDISIWKITQVNERVNVDFTWIL